MSNTLTHIDEKGNPKMVDVGDKPITRRRALAEAWVRITDETLFKITEGRVRKGDVIQVAQIAGIAGAKRTSDLIPLCHPLPIDAVDLKITPIPGIGLKIEAEVRAYWKTGVEMEALTACSAAALTIYDMVKAIERDAEIFGLRLKEKSGGRSGDWFSKKII